MMITHNIFSLLSRVIAALAVLAPALVIAQGVETPAKPPGPIAIWPEGPIDLVVVLDKPATPEISRELLRQPIAFGEKGSKDPLGSIRVMSIHLEDGGQTLRLGTDPHPLEATYTLRPAKSAAWSYDLKGVEATWKTENAPADASPDWTGWLPVVDLAESRKALEGSGIHARGFEDFRKPGQLTLASQAALPPGKIRVEVKSSEPIEEFLLGNEAFEAQEGAEAVRAHLLSVDSAGEFQFMSIRTRTGQGRDAPTLAMRYWVGDFPEAKSFDRGQFLLPWAPTPPLKGAKIDSVTPSDVELRGGDATRGEADFFGDQAQCGRCHKVRGKGGEVGPDLTEIGKKDPRERLSAVAIRRAVEEDLATGASRILVEGRESGQGVGIYDAQGNIQPEELAKIKTVPGSLGESLEALEKDHAFLLEGGVFTADLIRTYIEYKRTRELLPVSMRPHPYEFHLYSDI